MGGKHLVLGILMKVNDILKIKQISKVKEIIKVNDFTKIINGFTKIKINNITKIKNFFLKLRINLVPFKWSRFAHRYGWLGIILAVLLVIGGGMASFVNSSGTTMLLAYDQPLAVVGGKEQVQKVLGQVESELSQQYNLPVKGYKTDLNYDKSLAKDQKAISDAELAALLKNSLEWQLECWAIQINGTPKLYLATEEAANQAIESMKNYFLPKNSGETKIENVSFAEDVKVVRTPGVATEIRTPEEAVDLMVKGLDKIVQHTVVKGDTLFAIAQANNMTVEGLKKINPELKSDFLKLGQKLNLVKAEPLVNVSMTLTVSNDEKIPFGTMYESDSSLWRGQQRVKQEGVYGARQVTYKISRTNTVETARETLEEKVVSQPVSRVVRAGTKAMLVGARGDTGSGILGWPIREKINSAYGMRHRKLHTGTDIDGDIGDPIVAAGDGEVVSAGWNGHYGKCIVIDHDNGLTTLYGHLNAINVSVGAKVARGQYIGDLGTTGNSTGPHLHFEVRVGGQPKNPLNYLEK